MLKKRNLAVTGWRREMYGLPPHVASVHRHALIDSGALDPASRLHRVVWNQSTEATPANALLTPLLL
jgi:hypothetical protein